MTTPQATRRQSTHASAGGRDAVLVVVAATLAPALMFGLLWAEDWGSRLASLGVGGVGLLLAAWILLRDHHRERAWSGLPPIEAWKEWQDWRQAVVTSGATEREYLQPLSGLAIVLALPSIVALTLASAPGELAASFVQHPVAAVLFAAAVGTLLVALVITLRMARSRVSHLQVERLPLRPGGQLLGAIHASSRVRRSPRLDVRLTAVRRGRDARAPVGQFREQLLWCASQQALAVPDARPGRWRVPAVFDIPPDALPSDLAADEEGVHWFVELRGSGGADDFHAEFEVPVVADGTAAAASGAPAMAARAASVALAPGVPPLPAWTTVSRSERRGAGRRVLRTVDPMNQQSNQAALGVAIFFLFMLAATVRVLRIDPVFLGIHLSWLAVHVSLALFLWLRGRRQLTGFAEAPLPARQLAGEPPQRPVPREIVVLATSQVGGVTRHHVHLRATMLELMEQWRLAIPGRPLGSITASHGLRDRQAVHRLAEELRVPLGIAEPRNETS